MDKLCHKLVSIAISTLFVHLSPDEVAVWSVVAGVQRSEPLPVTVRGGTTTNLKGIIFLWIKGRICQFVQSSKRLGSKKKSLRKNLKKFYLAVPLSSFQFKHLCNTRNSEKSVQLALPLRCLPLPLSVPQEVPKAATKEASGGSVKSADCWSCLLRRRGSTNRTLSNMC